MNIEKMVKQLKSGDGKAFAEVERQLRDGDERQRIEAAWALSSVSNRRTLEALTNALEVENDLLVAFIIACSIEKVDFFDDLLVLRLYKIANEKQFGPSGEQFDPVGRSIENFLNRALGTREKVNLQVLNARLKDATVQDISEMRKDGFKARQNRRVA